MPSGKPKPSAASAHTRIQLINSQDIAGGDFVPSNVLAIYEMGPKYKSVEEIQFDSRMGHEYQSE